MWYSCTWGRCCKGPHAAFRAAKLCYRRCHEETRTNKNPQIRGLQWANRGLQMFVTHFLLFFFNLHNKTFIFIVLSSFFSLHAVNTFDVSWMLRSFLVKVAEIAFHNLLIIGDAYFSLLIKLCSVSQIEIWKLNSHGGISKEYQFGNILYC